MDRVKQEFDNALASPKDQMIQNVQVVFVLFLLTVSSNLNSAASKSVIFPRLLKLSILVLYDAGNVVYGLLYFSDSTVRASQSSHKDFFSGSSFCAEHYILEK